MIGLIVGREYSTRVRKVSFWVISLLTPILLLLCMFIPTLIMILSGETERRIGVVDRSEEGVASGLESSSAVVFARMDGVSEVALRDSLRAEALDGYMVFAGADSIVLYSLQTIPMDVVERIEGDVSELLRRRELALLGDERMDSVFHHINGLEAEVRTLTISESGEEKASSSGVAFGLSMLMSMVIFFVVLGYGSMIMTSIMEEKQNRIMEVLVSSVRPMELLAGKIIGVGCVMLTQLALWGVLLFGGMLVMGVVGGVGMSMSGSEMGQMGMSDAEGMGMMMEVMDALGSLNIAELLVMFLIYFVGGYLLYGSLFACVGSALESSNDGQQIQMIVTGPLLVAFYLGVYGANDPSSGVAFWSSMIPLTSPVVMMSRLPYGVDLWELLLSVFLLVGGVLLNMWVAARVYRVGVLMYGKKASLGELYRWFRQSE